MSTNRGKQMNQPHQVPPEVNCMGADILNTELWIGSQKVNRSSCWGEVETRSLMDDKLSAPNRKLYILYLIEMSISPTFL